MKSELFEARAELAAGLTNQAESLRIARMLVAAMASSIAFPVDVIDDIKLAVSEAVTNCVLHASSSRRFELRCSASDREIRIVVRDQGPGLTDAPAPDAPVRDDTGEFETAPNGRGLSIIRALMDHVTLRSDPKTGTELMMTKRLIR